MSDHLPTERAAAPPRHRVTLIPGDGVGPEVVHAARRVQGVQREVEGLPPGRDPGVANIHGVIVLKPRTECK